MTKRETVGWDGVHQMYNFLVEYLLHESDKEYLLAEVGVFCGLSALNLCKKLKQNNLNFVLYLVDIWDSPAWDSYMAHPYRPGRNLRIREAHQQFKTSGCSSYTKMIENIFEEWGFTKNVVVDNRGSVTSATKKKRSSFDLVMIDASHTEKKCSADLKAWEPLVKKGGVICGDDWHFKGVEKAVRKYFKMPVREFDEAGFRKENPNPSDELGKFIWLFRRRGGFGWAIFK
jgi:predicted O-methyltransferase YrrM